MWFSRLNKLVCVLCAVLLWLPVVAVGAEPRVNVVLIVADDLGAMDLGCYGSKFHRTPHLDRLAADGMRFTQAYAACPVCSPSRAALLTGQYPQRFQLTDWLPGRPDRPDQRLKRPTLRQHLPLDAGTIADVLKPAGYVCGRIGKWHLGGEGFEPTRHGFELNIAGDAAGTPASYFAPFAKPGGKAMPGLQDAPEGEYVTDRLAVEAEKFIEQHHERPFFLYLPHFAVHTPMRAKDELVKKYPEAGTFRGQQNNPIYAAMLESLDDAVGRIIHTLDERKLSERTIVIFTSDNGGLATVEGPNTPATSNAPLREGKGWLYEGGLRVPLLVKWPGVVKPGGTSDALVCHIDLFPTIMETTNTRPTRQRGSRASRESDPSPARRAGVDGVSLVPVLQQTGSITRDALFWHYPHYANQGGRPGGVIRAGEWKLIEFYEERRRELFHLANDVSESRNLAEQEPERVRELLVKFDAWRKDVGALMPELNSEYVPNPQAANREIVLPAKTADVRGVMLRFEPLPHKNTLGYWVNANDWARWEFTVTQPGKFQLEALVGCGNGSGGSDVRFEIGEQVLSMTVPETGGFQNFVPRMLGEIQIDKLGRHELRVKPIKKPGAAVMDLRQVRLLPVK
jgi:arylsulfatase A